MTQENDPFSLPLGENTEDNASEPEFTFEQPPYFGEQPKPQVPNPYEIPAPPVAQTPFAQPENPYAQPGPYGTTSPYGYAQSPYAQPAPNPNQALASVPGAPMAPYGNPNYVQRSRLAAGLLQCFLGVFGVGRFYLGYTGIGLAQLLITVLTFGLGAVVTSIWGIIDGILILTGSPAVDAKGVPLRD
ncbi:MAG: NINE protein [Propionibacteriaceae bacterium]|jgi:TM2 domain-containing membrane protein YozV|nr:NINE protein [Propionibacteriaceae bacterium]